MLSQMGSDLKRPIADYLRDGVYELRWKIGTVNYRILYFFHGEGCCALSHGITKTDEVPDGDINTAVARKLLVESDQDKYTADFGVTDGKDKKLRGRNPGRTGGQSRGG
jgi:phage-related protein